MEYETVEEYVRDLSESVAKPVITIAMAAELFGIGAAAVNARIKRGALESLRISGSNYVVANSAIAQIRHLDADARTLRKFVERQAQKGEIPIFYAPGMELLGMDHRKNADRTRFGYLLGGISRQTYAEHKFLLSAMVQKKGTDMPSENGFFTLVDDLGLRYEDTDEGRKRFVDSQLRKIREHYRSQNRSNE